MKKKLLKIFKWWVWITVWILAWIYIIYSVIIYKRFKEDCFERVRANNNPFKEYYCPNNFFWYTEERWYFVDKYKQDEYFKNKVKECWDEIIECREENKKKGTHTHCAISCNKYWEPDRWFN